MNYHRTPRNQAPERRAPHYQQPEPRQAPRRGRRRRTPLIVWFFAVIGFVTVVVLALRYAVIPLLVMLGGMS